MNLLKFKKKKVSVNFELYSCNLIDKINYLVNEKKKNTELYLKEKIELIKCLKRYEKNILLYKKYFLEDLIKDLLNIVDSLEYGFSLEKFDRNYYCLKLIHKMILSVLFKYYVVINFKKTNMFFDSKKHEIISIFNYKNNNFMDNQVIAVLQNGFLLHNRIIRNSKVCIYKKKEVKKK